jgi:uncharacterized protein (TIRG00374 family)
MLLAIGVYGAFVVATGYGKISGALHGFHFGALAAALALSSLNYLIRFAKWEFYLRRLGIFGVPKGDSLLVFLSGFVLTVTPGKLGEVLKSAVLSETYGVDPARTAPIVVAERLTDVISIIVLIIVGSLGFSFGLVWATAGSCVVAAGLALILWKAPLNALLRYSKSHSGWLGRIYPRLEIASVSLRVVASPSALLVPTLLSIVGWGCEGLGLWCLLSGLSQTIAFPLALFIYATATLAGALVPLPGGLGIAETMFQSQLVELGDVSSGAATASMLMIRFATLWWAVIVGFGALLLLRRKFPNLLRS